MNLEVMQMLRERRGLDDNDASEDSKILAMSPHEKLQDLFGFRLGDEEWANVVVDWMRECGYHVTTERAL
jgi:hypothetical protein